MFLSLFKEFNINNEKYKKTNTNFKEIKLFLTLNMRKTLISSSTTMNISKKKGDEYEYNPKLVSLEQYGDIKYWFFIIFVNGYKNIDEFHNFSSILIPNKNVLDNILNKI